jgi:hypothetical protein
MQLKITEIRILWHLSESVDVRCRNLSTWIDAFTVGVQPLTREGCGKTSRVATSQNHMARPVGNLQCGLVAAFAQRLWQTAYLASLLGRTYREQVIQRLAVGFWPEFLHALEHIAEIGRMAVYDTGRK